MVGTNAFHKQINGPAVAVDTVVFTIKDKKLQALLIQIGSDQYKNYWAIPGGLVQEFENTDEAAIRTLESKTNIANIYLEQLYTFGDAKRDQRGHVISVAYFSIIYDYNKLDLKTLPYYNDIKWFDVSTIPDMAFDHKEIIEYAVNRLRSKIEYTNIAYNFLPIEFTLTDLQEVYEIVLNRPLDKRNFRKKIEILDLLSETDKMRTDVGHRPARLYKFKRRYLEFLN